MNKKCASVFGLYPTRKAVRTAIDSLQRAGYALADLSVLIPKVLSASEHEPKGDILAERASIIAGPETLHVGTVGLLARILEEGGMLLSVHCEGSDQLRQAKDILETTGAQDVSFSEDPLDTTLN